MALVLLGLALASVAPVMGIISADCNNISYQAASNPSLQYGYNLCNATTENQSSLCQTAFINGPDDFCLWGPADPISDSPMNDNQMERTVAWCTKPGHGTRLIPPGALFDIRFIKTPAYVEVYGAFDGRVNGTPLNYLGDPRRTDITAQYDPRAIDQQGTPIGGLVFSTAFDSSNGTNVQAIEWDSMIGWDIFYLRACDPNVPGSADYCTRWNNANFGWDSAVFNINGESSMSNTFLSCEGDSRPLGLLLDGDGNTITYTGQAVPTHSPVPPAVSNCVTYDSTQLFGATSISPGASVCTASLVSSSTTTGTSSSTSSSSSNSSFNQPIIKSTSAARAGAIIGAALGGIVLVALLVILMLVRRRRRENQHGSEYYSSVPKSHPGTPPAGFTPNSGTFLLNNRSSDGYVHEDASIHTPWAIPIGPVSESALSYDDDLPPGYAVVSPRRTPSSVPTTSIRESIFQHDDELGRWVSLNRSVVPPELEAKLRAAQYLPSDNPAEITPSVWRDRHGVGHFELKRLQELFASRCMSQSGRSSMV